MSSCDPTSDISLTPHGPPRSNSRPQVGNYLLYYHDNAQSSCWENVTELYEILADLGSLVLATDLAHIIRSSVSKQRDGSSLRLPLAAGVIRERPRSFPGVWCEFQFSVEIIILQELFYDIETIFDIQIIPILPFFFFIFLFFRIFFFFYTTSQLQKWICVHLKREI